MRLIGAIIALVLFASGPAAAQSWQEYRYPEYSFGVSFPTEPKLETKTYQTADGGTAPAHVYSAAGDNSLFIMTVVDLSAVQTDEKTVIDHAIKTLAQGGEVKLNIPHRISRVYGRQLSITGSDGRHSSIALFYNQQRLYQIEGVALPAGADGTADAIRFQQSLIFTNGTANRSRLEPIFQIVGRIFSSD
jgi:hypothetical protein